MQRSIDANVSHTGSLGGAPAAIDTAMAELGPSNQVTALTASDFGLMLATWMGVSASNLSTVVPGIGNYSLRDLGLFV